MKQILVFWPSFLVAGIAEMVFFTVMDPQQLYLFGQPVEFSPIATYSIGFFGFWLVCAASSMLTVFFQRSADDLNRSSGSAG
ncbi:hypothetical protein [Denitromonas ohlonensis]|jgi:hypothetical protein|uniref:Uncharacterized protein n=2 Tax=Denitromonas TaxID=139331 RepID=A0A557SMC5_9RHOO|nr:hypothetical protein [Denitromonas ohlonensis]TVT46453.1 MAG: hypothetical protein FHP94_16910 [Denitromonas halophila]TVO60413.1 hypothetical protein FHP90_18320 [Denitromonas ohlonensis]TVO78578.1 hypothetical protein FHP89_05145 [Denitromonas ohlonensis]TVT66213.1 MAG: hypothetical protein FHP93_19345 [Denitromonas halophila]TVT75559.1 MAG: hypothetical protein FHP92_11425 [Denitromonas halophila]